MISRRQILAMAGPATAWLASPSRSQAWQAPDRTRMGGAPTAFAVRSQAARRGGKPFDMVEHCHGLGLAGVQTNPPSTDTEAIKKFRERVEAYHMHLICDPRRPRQERDVAAFDAQVKAYKEAGAIAFHAAMTGRRYEDFVALDPFKKMFEQCQKTVELAEPRSEEHTSELQSPCNLVCRL